MTQFITKVLTAMLLLTLMSCNEDDPMMVLTPDVTGPEIRNLRWIDHPSRDVPSGPVEEGGNYQISIAAGFHLAYEIYDESDIRSSDSYMLVNDDPTISKPFLTSDVLAASDASHGFSFSWRKIPLEDGQFYDLQVGDTFHFYLNVDDEHGNVTSIRWTADLVE